MINLQKLKADVAEVVRYSQNIEEPKIDRLIDTWRTAKAPLMNKFFNGSTRITSDEKVVFQLNEDAKRQRYESFVEYVANLLEAWGGWDSRLVRYLQHITTKDFYSNCLFTEYKMHDGKKIQKGTKVVKSFKYFIDDEKLLHDIQNKASEIIQENKVEGYLVFSVHPLDFLSSSENAFNWRSCHALDGEYRTGNLSYMCDSSTMICYLMTGEDVKLPHFPETIPWNNKKWRVLLHFNTDFDVVFAGRQYPFTSPGALEKMREVMLEYMFPKSVLPWSDKPSWSHWHNDYIEDFNYSEYSEEDSVGIEEETYVVINGGIWNIHKIVKDAKNSKHFNDLIRSSCYTKPYYMFAKGWCRHHKLVFNIGAEITCLRCDEKTIDGYDSMMCPDCECQYGNSDSDEYRTCDCCGIRFYDANGYWVGDEYVCEHCYDTQCFVCEHCGETYYNSEKCWDEDNKQFLCSDCYNDR